jgi:putative membrane-bound dehydrogenase-like protein
VGEDAGGAMSHPCSPTVGVAAALILLNVGSSPARELDGVYKPFGGPCPTVDEQIKKATLPPGYALRNFAAEPMVVNPVAMTWDARGRLWVVELYEYPLGAKKPNEYSKTATDESFRPVVKTDATSPRDRVIILEDTDNDGAADKRTIFIEGLNLATGVLCGYGGAFVGQAPNLFFFRDTDGDDKADEYKSVLTGFGLEDRHELLNSFTWGPDGYLYFTHGVFTHSKVRRPGEPKEQGITLNAGIYRVKFDRSRRVAFQATSPPTNVGLKPTDAKGPQVGKDADPTVARHEVFADGTSNPWGCDYDAAGNWFVEACVIDHLFHMAPGGLYRRQGGAPENPYAYELLPSIVNHKHFRAAYAGIQVYQGGVYPQDTHGHLFFGNIHDNSIHEEKVEPVGATFKASPVRDFLRANDGWFRPVSLQTGPDGFLWVMDWCDKYPCYQNANANPEGVDRERGRIWRIVHGNAGTFPARPEKDMDLFRLPIPALVDIMESPNNWMRRHAAQALSERVNEQGIREQILKAGLSTVALGHTDPPPTVAVRLDAIRACVATRVNGVMTSSLPQGFKKDRSPEVRALAARLIGEQNELDLADPAALAELALDPNPMVRSAVATAFRQSGVTGLTRGSLRGNLVLPSEFASNLVTGSWDQSKSPLSFAIWMGIEPRLAAKPEVWTPWLAERAIKNKPLSLELTYKTMRRLCDTRKTENLDLAFSYLDTVSADGGLVATALDGLVKGQEAGAIKPTRDVAAHFEKWSKHEREDIRRFSQQLATLWGDPKAVLALMGVVLDEKADVAKRIEAIRTVRQLKSDQARAGILTLFNAKSPDALTIETLRAAGELGGNDLANAILKGWQGYSTPVKSAAAEVLVSRRDWANRLLDGVEGKWVSSGAINASDIPVSVRRRLDQDAAIKDRATKVLGRWNESGADVKALIAAKRKACLEGEPDLAAGKIIYTISCAVCHPFHGGGQEVGPDLIGSGRPNLEALLVNIIDPNQIIGNGYQNFLITTKDGRTLSGRVIEDTPTQVTLLGIGGARQVVPRGDIAEIKDTGQSTMPMGFGVLPDDVFRNLVWYILAPPEEGPLTKEKKAELSRSIDEGGGPAPNADPKKSSADASEPRPDRESASLWNPEWKLDTPDFEGTPTKLPEYRGRKNVLVLHPYDRQKPGALVRTLELPKDQPATVSVWAASHDKGDWELSATANGRSLGKPQRITHDHPDARWTKATFDLAPFAGQKVELRLENHATDWSYEFSYWSDLTVVW